jgi:uncharacterized repeat protein (TIGR01451 family)
MRTTHLQLIATAALVVLTSVLNMNPSTCDGQLHRPVHAMSSGNLPPGDVAFHALLGNPQWAAQIQPVRIQVPENAEVQIWSGNGFVPGSHPAPVVGLSIGPVARFCVTFQRLDAQYEIYPSIELINRLSPPPGLELKFPVEVVLTLDDLIQASQGRLVTRVVYLENPDTALPFQQRAGEQAFFDIGEREDPLTVASRLGRPMAIVRLGSRVPTHDELDRSFFFGGAPLQEFPQQFFEGVDEMQLPAGSSNRRTENGIQRVSWNQDQDPALLPGAQPNGPPAAVVNLRDENGFVVRDGYDPTAPMTFPQSICEPVIPHAGMTGYGGAFRFSNPVPKDEYLFDGDDRNYEVLVDQNWKLYGLDTEDTVGHFDTLDGRRLVVPSNRVGIYSPRFASVRKVNDWVARSGAAQLAQFRDRDQMQSARGSDFSSTTLQQLMPGLNTGRDRASGVEDHTRGVLADQVVHMTGFRTGFAAYENLQLIRFGKYSSSEKTRLQLGMQSAGVWETRDGLQVMIDRDQPVVVNDALSAQELITVKVGDGKTLLRIAKVASKIAAQPGEEVEFTIRFDNVGEQLIGNVTIIDSLTNRLEYVDGSSECSMKGDFLTERNDGDSLVLRWEITEPVKPNEGGIIRFRCRVR